MIEYKYKCKVDQVFHADKKVRTVRIFRAFLFYVKLKIAYKKARVLGTCSGFFVCVSYILSLLHLHFITIFVCCQQLFENTFDIY